MHLIAGLGNPKSKYSGSRHNLGFRVVQALSRRLKTGNPAQKHRALFTVTEYKGHKLMLAQPLTYMNRSGLAVYELMRNNQVDLSELLIIYDDLDLPPGSIRLRKKGGGAGHRGVQSVIEALGTEAFPRLRIGIGKPSPGMETANYVLQPLGPPDLELIDPAVNRAVEAVLVFVSEGLEKAMEEFNQGLSSHN